MENPKQRRSRGFWGVQKDVDRLRYRHSLGSCTSAPNDLPLGSGHPHAPNVSASGQLLPSSQSWKTPRQRPPPNLGRGSTFPERCVTTISPDPRPRLVRITATPKRVGHLSGYVSYGSSVGFCTSSFGATSKYATGKRFWEGCGRSFSLFLRCSSSRFSSIGWGVCHPMGSRILCSSFAGLVPSAGLLQTGVTHRIGERRHERSSSDESVLPAHDDSHVGRARRPR